MTELLNTDKVSTVEATFQFSLYQQLRYLYLALIAISLPSTNGFKPIAVTTTFKTVNIVEMVVHG